MACNATKKMVCDLRKANKNVNNRREKLLDPDWLRALQFKCNTCAKSVTPVQITNRNSGL